MKTETRSLPPLRDRATKLIEYLKRYGLLFQMTASRLYPDLSPEALRKFLERLEADGWIYKHRLPGASGSYWVLSSRACNRLDLKRRSSAFKQAPLIKHCMTALFFAVKEHLRLLTSSECREMLPQIYERGNASYYFLDATQTNAVRLGWLLVDDGKRPLRVWSKAKDVAASKKAIPALYSLCQAGGFSIAVVTTVESKAAKLRDIFSDRPLRDIPVEVVAVAEHFPELLIPGRAR